MVLTEFFFNANGCKVNVDLAAERFIEECISKVGLKPAEPMVKHDFNPYGKTIIVILHESHLLLHTWPEYKAVLIDFFPCSDIFDIGKIDIFVDLIHNIFEAEEVRVSKAVRVLKNDN